MATALQHRITVDLTESYSAIRRTAQCWRLPMIDRCSPNRRQIRTGLDAKQCIESQCAQSLSGGTHDDF